ncbi:MAG TPA: AMP-binding protein, partial [Opitutus sp.]|nr:AMP-binding protein [Opitutus sp.]
MKTNLGEALLAHCRNRLPPDAFLYVEPDSQIAVRDFVALAQGAGRFWQDRLRPGERVVIAKPDSIDHIACFCGVLLAGGVPVSVNPALKPTALAALIADCGALHLVAEPGVAAEAPRPPGLNVWDASRQSPRGQPNVLDPALRTGEVYPVLRDDTDLAVLQYSSGTTGAPKGIMQSARGILSYCETFARQHLQLHPGDLTYSVARVHFAFGAGNSVFFPLYCGCPTFLDPRRPTLEVVLDNLALVRPTAFFAVPTVFRWILAADVAPRAADVLRELRIAGSAGLPLSADLFERF